MNTIPFVSQKTGGHHLPCWWHHLGLLWRGGEGCFRCMDCCLVSFSKWWIQNSSWVRKRSRKLAGSASRLSAKFACDMITLVCFWSGVKSRGTHRAETFDMPSLLCGLVVPRRCLQHQLSNQQLNVCHPSPCVEHGRCFPGCWLWQDVRTLIIFKALPTPLEFSCPHLHSW